MRIKLVALVDPSILEKLKSADIRPRADNLYKETLLLHMKGAYGVPELVGIRYPPEHEEKATTVHYGHDIRNQEENVLEHGEKDRLMMKFLQLGFQPIGEFTVKDFRFAWREFEGRLICILELNLCFLQVYRNFPGEDTELFAEKQKRAWHFLESLGIKKEQLLPVDYWGFIVTSLLQGGQQQAGAPQ
ncbi:MAG: hypothetical protein GXO00_00235 [Candidatus Diapherotrites archaeon]|nr:hypothetical protein [Candidatus Diapherotrites archaeon]